jgi:hypothetical protein
MENELDKKQAETKPAKSSRKWVIGAVLVFVLIISVFAFQKIFPDGLFQSYYTYNNFEFRKISGLWTTEVFDTEKKVTYQLPLHYGPKELEYIPVGKSVALFPEFAHQFSGPKKIGATYVTYDPDINDSQISLAYYELSRHMETALHIETLPAITHDVEKIVNETIRECGNSTDPVIYLSYKNSTLVDFRGNCLIIQGEGIELVKAADRALYQFYGIMK